MSGTRSGRSGRVLVVVGLVLALLVGLGVFLLTRDAEPGDEDVFLVGDSLTVDAGGVAPWPGGWLVDAYYGRSTDQGAEILEATDLTDGIVVIVALGTNDSSDDEATYAGRIDRVVEAIGPDHRILWVNVDTNTPQLAQAAGVNAAIDAAPDRHPQVEVADWDEYVTTVDGFDELRDPDGVHYLPEGSEVRAAWMVDLVPRAG